MQETDKYSAEFFLGRRNKEEKLLEKFDHKELLMRQLGEPTVCIIIFVLYSYSHNLHKISDADDSTNGTNILNEPALAQEEEEMDDLCNNFGFFQRFRRRRNTFQSSKKNF